MEVRPKSEEIFDARVSSYDWRCEMATAEGTTGPGPISSDGLKSAPRSLLRPWKGLVPRTCEEMAVPLQYCTDCLREGPLAERQWKRFLKFPLDKAEHEWQDFFLTKARAALQKKIKTRWERYVGGFEQNPPSTWDDSVAARRAVCWAARPTEANSRNQLFLRWDHGLFSSYLPECATRVTTLAATLSVTVVAPQDAACGDIFAAWGLPSVVSSAVGLESSSTSTGPILGGGQGPRRTGGGGNDTSISSQAVSEKSFCSDVVSQLPNKFLRKETLSQRPPVQMVLSLEINPSGNIFVLREVNRKDVYKDYAEPCLPGNTDKELEGICLCDRGAGGDER